MGFLDEGNYGIDLNDISELNNHDFSNKFRGFDATVSRTVLRFRLRVSRGDKAHLSTPLTILNDSKFEISELLNTVRKIVTQEFESGNKRDAIFSKLSALQAEVDKDMTTVDAFFGRTQQVIKATEEMGKVIEPLNKLLSKLKDFGWNKTEQQPLLPTKERQKLISQDKQDNGPAALDDDIPF